MQAKNIHGENIDEIKSAFSKATPDGYAPTLAIVFCSIVQDRKALTNFFNEKEVDVFGATTAGEIIDDEVMEHTSVIMLLNMKKKTIKYLPKKAAIHTKWLMTLQNLRKKVLAILPSLLYQAG